MTEDEQLLEDYSKELFGCESKNRVAIGDLIRHSREYIKRNEDVNNTFNIAHAEGYQAGYRWGISQAEENTIMLEDLRKMTFQEIANLIGDENDY